MTQTFYLDPTQGSNGSGTIGSPFNSMYNAWAGISTAFNSATEDYEVICLAGADSNAGNTGANDPIIIDPSNASATARVLRFIASGANRHTGVRSTGYRLPAEVRFNHSNTAVTGELNGLVTRRVALDQVSNSIVVRLLNWANFDDPSDASFCGGGTMYLENCLIVDPAFTGILAESNNGTPTIHARNCTVVGAANSRNGLLAQFGGVINGLNCYSGNNAGDDYFGCTLTSCLSEDGTLATSTAAYSTANFTSVTGGSQNMKLPSGSALIGAGVGPGSNGDVPTSDFEGDARSGATTDVGFDQRATAGGGISVAWLRA